MIFASDLDRTLIFSKRALEELGGYEPASLKPAEERLGEMTAFMTSASLTALKKVCANSLFVPITTRTTEQFKRIFLFQKAIPVKYAVTSNGANVLFNGIIQMDWSERISGQMKRDTSTPEELFSFIQKEGLHLNGQFKSAENLFFYYILDKPLPLEKKLELETKVSGFGWRISQQGRKLYFIPNAVSKGAALQYICERSGKEAMAGAGDSVLDWDFLKNCHHRFVPLHGELATEPGFREYTLTENNGVLAGEEILERFLEFL